MPAKTRPQGQTYVAKTPTGSQPVSLNGLFSLAKGHVVYVVNILNPTGNGTIFVGHDGTSDYQLLAGASKDFYFTDPAEIRLAATSSAQTVYIDVSGEFPGTCPICDAGFGDQSRTAKAR